MRDNSNTFFRNRRQFIGTASTVALASILPKAFAAAKAPTAFNPSLLAPLETIWSEFETLASFCPHYTGNAGHIKFVDFLANGLQSAGLEVHRDTYKFPRWQAKNYAITATPKGGAPQNIPVSFYYPQSGQTGPNGVTAPLAYAGKLTTSTGNTFTLPTDVKGKIAYVDFEVILRDYAEWFHSLGSYTPDTRLTTSMTSIIAVAAPLLTEFKKAGAVGVIFGWTNLSEGHCKNQNLPFGHGLQEIPTLWVGPAAATKLRTLAQSGASATLTLDADIFQNSPTDTVYATLPGSTPGEAIIINTHTDGPNAVQENGGIGIINLARYLARVPQSQRNRSFVFVLATGHYASEYVPSIYGFIKQHPDIIKQTVASFAIEHLGCQEWLDNAAMQYVATGKDDINYAVTRHPALAKIVLESAPGTGENRVAAGSPTAKGRYLGEAAGIGNLNIPTMGYFAGPTYLNMEAPDACISKLSKTRMYGQLHMIAKALHKIDATPATELSQGIISA